MISLNIRYNMIGGINRKITEVYKISWLAGFNSNAGIGICRTVMREIAQVSGAVIMRTHAMRIIRISFPLLLTAFYFVKILFLSTNYLLCGFASIILCLALWLFIDLK